MQFCHKVEGLDVFMLFRFVTVHRCLDDTTTRFCYINSENTSSKMAIQLNQHLYDTKQPWRRCQHFQCFTVSWNADVSQFLQMWRTKTTVSIQQPRIYPQLAAIAFMSLYQMILELWCSRHESRKHIVCQCVMGYWNKFRKQETEQK